MLLDAHQHFWRYDAAQYPWIPAASPLHRDWLPADLAALQRPLGLAGSIAVQARQCLAENDWLLGLADADERVRGVVGWVDLCDPAVDAELERLARHPKFCGVRHVAQDEPDDGFLARPDFIRGVRKLTTYGLTYDILIYARQMPAALALIEACPGQRFILDHIGKPAIRHQELEPWRRQLRALAAHPHVWCKISGMVTEADHATWKPDDFRPYWETTLAAFGPERLLWGSDWPVCLFAATYAQTFHLAEEALDTLTNAERTRVFGGNCAAFYLHRTATPPPK